jgi:hypothetical protein
MKKPAFDNPVPESIGKVKAMTRRNFMSSCAACAACMAFAPFKMVDPSWSSTKAGERMRIRIMYSLHSEVQAVPDWPNIGYDFRLPMERINTALIKRFPDFEFIPALASGAEDARKIIDDDGKNDIAGYIVYQMNCWNQVIQTIAGTGKPVLYADFQFAGSGGFLVYNSLMLAEKSRNVGFVASSRMEDLFAAVSCFNIVKNGGSAAEFVTATVKARLESVPAPGKLTWLPNNLNTLSADDCIRRLKNSRILAVNDQNARMADPVMGIPVAYIAFSEINDAWNSADKDEARNIVERWQKSASAIVDVPFETLETSAAMYIGMKSVLNKHNANAITVNCLGGFYGGHIHAYPCLGFHELCNEGLIGACECDVSSTATMLAFNTMTNGRPGFISDPVIDTSKRRIIYAHCVAPNKVFGPDGQTNPFSILTHSEDRKGASVRSVLPLNYLTTTLEISNERKEILFHQAVSMDNDPDDRACRTKLCAAPLGDMEKLFSMWHKWGWHRVTFYGDLKEPVYELADALGWRVIEEA